MKRCPERIRQMRKSDAQRGMAVGKRGGNIRTNSGMNMVGGGGRGGGGGGQLIRSKAATTKTVSNYRNDEFEDNNNYASMKAATTGE